MTAHRPTANTAATSVRPGRASNQSENNVSRMPKASMTPQYGITPRPLMEPAIVTIPLSSTYQPMKKAITSNVGPGQTHTASPTTASISPKATDQPRTAPSRGTLNIVKTPLNTNSAPTNAARSPMLQSVKRMMPPATTLTMPVKNNTHQLRLMLSI